MKKVMSICLCIGLLFTMSGCSKEETPSVSYDEAKILEMGETVINKMNEEDYQAVIDMGNQKLKDVLTAEQLKSGMDMYVLPLGAFKENEAHEIATQDDYIVIGFISVYEKGKIQYTISFDQNNAMAGIRLAPAS